MKAVALPLFDAYDAAEKAKSEPSPCKAIYDDVQTFILREGRYPRITDAKKPWSYRGWCVPYLLDAEATLDDVPKRWDYLARTLETGKLLDEPIPRITFTHTGERDECFKLVGKLVNILDESTHGGWSSFTNLIDWLGWALGQAKEPPVGFDDKINERLYREVNIIPLLQSPADWFGEWLAMQRGNWNPLGFYPTPHSIVEMMVRVNFPDDNADYRSTTVCDPALGTGRMLLHASNYSLRLYGQDIDQTVLKICKINGALYAPWLVRPLPDKFFTKENDNEGKGSVRNPEASRRARPVPGIRRKSR